MTQATEGHAAAAGAGEAKARTPKARPKRSDTGTKGGHDPHRRSGPIQTQAAKIMPLVEAQAEKRAPAILPYLHIITPLLVEASGYLDLASPFILTACGYVYELYRHAPTDLLYALVGLSLCFFGGSFVATIAAVEAFKICGWDRCWSHLKFLWADYRIARARAKRAAIEARARGEDAPQLAAAEDILFAADLTLTQRIALMGECIQKPEKLSEAIGGLYAALLGVITTLRLQFARVIALGASIANMLRGPAQQHIAPPLTQMLPPKYQQWGPTLVNWVCRIIAISIAWNLQRMLSAVQSALRGGLLCSRRALAFARRRGWVGERAKESLFDDYIGYVIAAAGLYTQLHFGFQLPFPLNVILLPVSILEWWLQWFM
eukprot:TRINITY_DN46842_c0_g1_i1.p1 TRINITY_DN46842_c0_g1~~TRINITY_DN46842_c0_g1_i1.p1  ORF type:complete len:406 (+),score=154.06 TRINITY_DN46842_c0_g1_i1:91-1218(+)